MADPSWSDLPADVLATVLGELEFPDLFRSAAAACTTWRAAARALLRLGIYNRSQSPCLFYTAAAAAGTRAAELFSLADKTTYKAVRLPDPPIEERNIVGSSHGWLVTADARSELLLLNPATGDQIDLPPVSTVEQIKEPMSRKAMPCTSSGTPCISRSCYPATLRNPFHRQLSFARVGDEMWHWATTSFHDSQYSDCIFHEGAFYAMNSRGGIHRHTIEGSCATRDVILKDVSPFVARNYISRSSTGDVLQIWRMTNGNRETACIQIYKVDFDKQKIAGMRTLGDDALFIGHNYTCCVSTKDCPMLLPNHVYFTEDDGYRLYDRKDNRRSVEHIVWRINMSMMWSLLNTG
ncbi:hypothetical protein BRADI_4g42510v3 [Brachypodium distachyon]|uniref:KIB1-4 beta-propeller domain-containing protein n=1 Tax=Brachypodium distachyon TaxID=15368 RepID=A0A2K2CTT9_BRADI|nr:hypothetical protein BRADI_4g42510v3 [Brachypodium distachyon]